MTLNYFQPILPGDQCTLVSVPQAGLAEALTKDESEDFNIDDYLVEKDAVSFIL